MHLRYYSAANVRFPDRFVFWTRERARASVTVDNNNNNNGVFGRGPTVGYRWQWNVRARARGGRFVGRGCASAEGVSPFCEKDSKVKDLAHTYNNTYLHNIIL